MKKNNLFLATATAVIFLSACGNNSAGTGTTSDSSANVTKPATNSDATNPSVADTAYSKNNADTTKTDSSKMKH